MMATLKNYLSMLAMAAAVFALPACSDDDDPTPEPPAGDEFVKQGILTEDETWTAENVYVLDGRVVVDEGVTLTIEPGTIIKAEEGQQTEASVLIVARGGKLIANGTAEQPIIFTSVLDNIQPGQTAGTNLTTNDPGLWGGVIILGRAPISVEGNNETANIEGVFSNEPYGAYGGDIADDNSGSLQYVSIRHGGVTIGADNEINGLTLGGVGSGTTIRNIEIVANLDDGIEWFGGTVNASNLLTWAQGDDGLDVDQAYSGTISNAAVVQGNEPGSGLELDGPEGETLPATMPFTVENVTIIGSGDELIADFRDGVLCDVKNILAYGFGAGSFIRITNPDSRTELENDNIIFSGWEVVPAEGVALDDLIMYAADEDSEPEEFPAALASKFTGNASVIESADEASAGADLSAFSWTYAAGQSAY